MKGGGGNGRRQLVGVSKTKKEWGMPIAVEATIQAIVFVVQVTPMGTNLGLANQIWVMVSGAFWTS